MTRKLTAIKCPACGAEHKRALRGDVKCATRCKCGHVFVYLVVRGRLVQL